MYNNYEGNYLEGFILTAKQYMHKSKKYQNFRLQMLDYHSLKTMSDFLDLALAELKIIDYGRYISAKYYCDGSVKDKLDKYLGIDDLLDVDDKDLVGIDWTNNLNFINTKVQKHKELKDCYRHLYITNTIVVCMQNVDLWEDLDEADLAKSLYKVLQLIEKEIQRKDYKGFLIVDVKSII